jgi:cytochrome c oxidase cbb3-type subunit 3
VNDVDKQPDNLPPDAPDDPLTDHEYDGIREYDNPTPGWWSMLFFLSFVFSVLYILFFHVGVGASVHEGYESASARLMTMKFGEIGDLEPNAQTILKYMNEPDWLAVGKSVFASKCATCHGSDAAGSAAPNLTDDLYVHVRKVEDIARVVTNGANNGNMPGWQGTLHINEIVLVSSYVASLRGENLPTSGWNGDAGQAIPPWPAESADEPSNE